MPRRITDEHIRRARAAVARLYGVTLDDEQARAVLALDESLLDELGEDGDLDTLPRSDLGDALIGWLMPGPPAAVDSLIGPGQERWHWPCFGSDERYRRAFLRVFRKAVAERCPPLRWKRAVPDRQETHCGRYRVAREPAYSESCRRWHAIRSDMDEQLVTQGFPTREAAKRCCEADARGILT